MGWPWQGPRYELAAMAAWGPHMRFLQSTKVTGDPNVPAGQITWCADLSGEVPLADLPCAAASAPYCAGRPYCPPAQFREGRIALGPADAAAEEEEGDGGGGGGGDDDDDNAYPPVVRAFRSRGRVAWTGFVNPSWSEQFVLLLEDGSIGVLWVELGSFSRFVRLPLGGGDGEERG